uniref:Ubiquitin-like domain-containing protein n=1 Tax=Piliocolobus tephrosceles TaxID=591936 RepID=A0A8C9HT41_9PRIM
MFIKVMFGGKSRAESCSFRRTPLGQRPPHHPGAAGCSVLVNTSCRLVNLTAHLRQKAGLPPDATIALLAEDGNLVSLEEDLKEGAARTQTMGNSLLKERAIYVLVRTIKGEDMVPTRYESLLENLDDHYPELAEELRRLSGLSSAGHNWRKRMGTRRGCHEQSPTSRPRKGPD